MDLLIQCQSAYYILLSICIHSGLSLEEMPKVNKSIRSCCSEYRRGADLNRHQDNGSGHHQRSARFIKEIEKIRKHFSILFIFPICLKACERMIDY